MTLTSFQPHPFLFPFSPSAEQIDKTKQNKQKLPKNKNKKTNTKPGCSLLCWRQEVLTLLAPGHAWNTHSDPTSPLITVKNPNQSPFLALLCHFGPAWEDIPACLIKPYVSNKHFHTLLVCVWHHQCPHLNQISQHFNLLIGLSGSIFFIFIYSHSYIKWFLPVSSLHMVSTCWQVDTCGCIIFISPSCESQTSTNIVNCLLDVFPQMYNRHLNLTFHTELLIVLKTFPPPVFPSI